MASNYGEYIAKHVNQARVNVGTAAWVALQVGDSPQNARRNLRFQIRSAPGGAMSIAYSNINADKTFTAPTMGVKGGHLIAGNATQNEPIGDKVMVYGRLWKKKAFADNSISVLVTEFS